MPVMMALIVDKGIPDGDNEYILKIGGLMLITAVVGLISALICQYSASVASQGFGTSVRNALFKKIMSFSYAQVDRFGVGTLSNRITNDTNQLQLGLAMIIRLVIRVPFICIGSVIATFIIDMWLGLIVLASLPLFVLALAVIMTRTAPLYTAVQSKLDALGRMLGETLSGVRVIRAFAKENDERIRFSRRNDELVDTTVRVGRMATLLNPITSLIMNLAIIAIVWFGGVRVNAGDLSQGQILAFISYITQMLASLIVFANLVIMITRAYASMKRINEILDVEEDLSENTALQAPEDTSLSKNKSALIFRDVGFSYPGSAEQTLSHISFSLEEGQTLGIIGATGSGKSTLVSLIQRFYSVTDGEILLKGRDNRNFPIEELRNKIGLVPQKVQLFTGSIADNLRWGNRHATDKMIEKAAATAQAAEFINKLPARYDTRLSKDGKNLSGGQRQRLAIARALTRQPEILILDDSASALDFATDLALRRALKADCAGMTAIIVSQRVWAVRSCDKILVMEDGAVIGEGTHSELMQSCKEYKEIALSQESPVSASPKSGNLMASESGVAGV